MTRMNAPDRGEKIAATREFKSLPPEARPILRHWRDNGSEAQRRAAIQGLLNMPGDDPEPIKPPRPQAAQPTADATSQPEPEREKFDVRAYVMALAKPKTSGEFDRVLERRVLRAILRHSAPDPDEKIAAAREFAKLDEEARPILDCYAENGTPSQQQGAKAGLITLDKR